MLDFGLYFSSDDSHENIKWHVINQVKQKTTETSIGYETENKGCAQWTVQQYWTRTNWQSTQVTKTIKRTSKLLDRQIITVIVLKTISLFAAASVRAVVLKIDKIDNVGLILEWVYNYWFIYNNYLNYSFNI